MPISVSNIRQVKCDADGCTRELMYDVNDHQAVTSNPDNNWLRTGRGLKTADGREFFYCSDACELKNLEKGKHNMPVVQEAATQQDVSAAVAMAKARAEADAKIRQGVTLA